MSVDDSKLFARVRLLPKRGFSRIVETVLLLWAVLSDPKVPAWVKALVAVALAYLINPFDTVPDFLPLGLADDAVLLVGTLAKVSGYVTPEARERARAKRRELGL